MWHKTYIPQRIDHFRGQHHVFSNGFLQWNVWSSFFLPFVLCIPCSVFLSKRRLVDLGQYTQTVKLPHCIGYRIGPNRAFWHVCRLPENCVFRKNSRCRCYIRAEPKSMTVRYPLEAIFMISFYKILLCDCSTPQALHLNTNASRSPYSYQSQALNLISYISLYFFIAA